MAANQTVEVLPFLSSALTHSVIAVVMIVGVRGLTARQIQIMELVVVGHRSKFIAADLGISQRTVENHRASIMRKTGAKSIPALVRLSINAAEAGGIGKSAFST